MSNIPTEPSAYVYSPSELNREAKLHLEAGFPRVLVEGEVSNLSRPASGHHYFSLKDESAQVRCAMFRSSVQRARTELRNGLKIVARGRISLYEARGEYQLIVDSVRDAGEGALQRAFEALKKKLGDEGLFDASLKRPLPAFPWRIGVITSPSGAAVRDVLHVLKRRWPAAAVRVYGASVQGAEAAGELRAALARANREAWAQVLILGRGGGSLEDLQAFNEESLARAVADSTLPVISAVGHETDFSICDFVADLRAPTPSAAAELATPDGVQVKAGLERHQRMLKQRMQAGLQQRMQHLDHLTHRLAQRDPARRIREQADRLRTQRTALGRLLRRRLADLSQRVAGAEARLNRQHPQRRLNERREHLERLARLNRKQAAGSVDRARRRLAELARTLNAVSPLATLERGYATLSDPQSGRVLTSVREVQTGARLDARLADGRIHCTVDSVSAVPAEDKPGVDTDGPQGPA
ncbi:exodeoxyribonuclease VII large subunit [Elongatibacter sediminis]|uniref:Exodeoxyribonuclease 7 large subunit n=1 Tax=Elongatibacter sediminis TaxID=3119006 RepID=A0AAW9RAS6_9GAMM